ncbi:TAL effector repeat-containing protein (plasmid) [Xanthomonas campestris pv. campestris]
MPPEPDPGAGGGHRQQYWWQAGAGDGAAAVTGAVPGPHGLTPQQVVAIASHDGGKQALETVQRLLPVLCQAPMA